VKLDGDDVPYIVMLVLIAIALALTIGVSFTL
jgi:hypothetical protein